MAAELKKTTVRLRPKQIKGLIALADAKGVGYNAILRWAVDEYLQKNLPASFLECMIDQSVEIAADTTTETDAASTVPAS